MTFTAIAAFLFILLQAPKSSIEGIVVNSITNKPIAGAQIGATRMPTLPNAAAGGGVTTGVLGGVVGRGGGPVQIAPARTDANGHFAFRDLETGTYQLRGS